MRSGLPGDDAVVQREERRRQEPGAGGGGCWKTNYLMVPIYVSTRGGGS